MTLGFAVPSQLAARTRPHCRFVFLRSRVCYALPSASPHGYALRFATVAVIGSGWLLSSNEILPMLGTLGQAPGLPGPLSSGSSRARSAGSVHHYPPTSFREPRRNCAALYQPFNPPV